MLHFVCVVTEILNGNNDKAGHESDSEEEDDGEDEFHDANEEVTSQYV